MKSKLQAHYITMYSTTSYVTVDGNVPIDGKVSLNNIRAVVDHKVRIQ